MTSINLTENTYTYKCICCGHKFVRVLHRWLRPKRFISCECCGNTRAEIYYLNIEERKEAQVSCTSEAGRRLKVAAERLSSSFVVKKTLMGNKVTIDERELNHLIEDLRAAGESLENLPK